ncbi:6015_t:CDS:2, partial [Scutellospora calospora]
YMTNWHLKHVEKKSWARISIQRNNNSWLVREINLELAVLEIHSTLTPINIKTIIDNPNKLAGYYPYQPSKDDENDQLIYKWTEFGNDSSFENIQNKGVDYTAFKSMFQQYKFEKNKSFP